MHGKEREELSASEIFKPTPANAVLIEQIMDYADQISRLTKSKEKLKRKLQAFTDKELLS
jgi:hypothetical protein